MPHPHHADLVMGRAPVRREVIPPHRLPFLVSTTIQGTHNPSLMARASNPSGAASTEGPKPTSQLMTTVLPVVLGAGYAD